MPPDTEVDKRRLPGKLECSAGAYSHATGGVGVLWAGERIVARIGNQSTAGRLGDGSGTEVGDGLAGCKRDRDQERVGKGETRRGMPAMGARRGTRREDRDERGQGNRENPAAVLTKHVGDEVLTGHMRRLGWAGGGADTDLPLPQPQTSDVGCSISAYRKDWVSTAIVASSLPLGICCTSRY